MNQVTVSIFPERTEHNQKIWRAVLGQATVVGRTPGKALDALLARLYGEDFRAPVVVRLWGDRNDESKECGA
jgi:hypothetical protein